MELRLYAQMLQRSWWIVALTALAALNIALIATFISTPIYRATARFVVSPSDSLLSGRDVVTSLEALDNRSIVATYAEVLNSANIYNQTVTSFGMTPEQLDDYERSTVVLPEANVLELAVEGPDPQMASALANAMGQTAINYIEGLNQVYDIGVLDPAKVPETPARPQPARDVSLALGLGLVVGAILAIVREQLRMPLEALLQRSTTDSASLAYTRRFFEERLSRTLASRQASKLSLGLIQLDGLREFTRMVPQPIQHQVLRQVTQTLHHELRGSDIVGRWSDTEFALMLPDTPGPAAVRTLRRIHIALSKPLAFNEDGETVRLRPVIGAAEKQDSESTQLLVERAAKALEQAANSDTKLVMYKPSAFVNV